MPVAASACCDLNGCGGGAGTAGGGGTHAHPTTSTSVSRLPRLLLRSALPEIRRTGRRYRACGNEETIESKARLPLCGGGGNPQQWPVCGNR